MLQNKPKHFSLIQETLKFITDKCSKYNNCNLFAFNNEDIVDNLKNYKDTRHHSEKINSYMLDKISSNDNIITNENIDNYLYEFVSRVKGYNIEAVVQELKAKDLWK